MQAVLALLLLASVLSASPAAFAEPMAYPDLVSTPPRNGSSPHVISFNGRSFLGVRFDGLIANVGEGPLDLYGNPSAGTVAQRVRSGEDWVEVANPPVVFENADMHNHWHLMRITRYSLWNMNRSAEVAPGEKVGFCLYDIEPVPGQAPAPAYYEGPVVQWCQAGNPNATELHMGISAGWTDVYSQGLTFQWIDVSNVAPGSYWLASQVDPENVIVESNEANNTLAFATNATVVPGYVARPVGPVVVDGPFKTVDLASDVYGSPGPRRFEIVTAPSHGTLDVAVGAAFVASQVRYSPDPGYVGPDSFSYVALDAASPYPLQPPAATVTLDVAAAGDATVAISGAPAAMTVGTSVQLTAAVTNASPSVLWSVNGIVGGSAAAGTITTAGLYSAPTTVPTGGSVTIRATSVEFEWAFDEVTIAMQPGQQPPVVTNPGAQQHLVGEAPRLSITASDPDGDALSYSATNLPPGLSVNSLTGNITGAPTTMGTWTTTFTASDGHAAGSATFTWTIVAAPPVIGALGDVTVDEGQSITVPLNVTDPQGFAFICTLVGPGYVTKNAANTLLTIAPGFDAAGTNTVTVTATNDAGAASSEAFTVTVRNVNRAPVLGSLPATSLDEAGVARIDVGAVDPDGDPLSLSVAGAAFASVDRSTGDIVLAPGYDDAGSYTLAVTATDPSGASVTGAFAVTVTDVDRAPNLSVVSNVAVAEGSTVSVPFEAVDPDGDPVELSLTGPPFARLEGSALTLTPGFSDAGPHVVVLRAEDGRGLGSTRVIDVTVTNTNRPPSIGTPGPVVAAEGETVTVPLAASDPDGDPVSFAVSGAAFTSVAGSTLFIEPGFDDAGSYGIVVTVSDPENATASATLTLTVTNVNRPPAVALPASATVAEGAVATIPISASDPDGEVFTLEAFGAQYVSIVDGSLRVAPGFDDAGSATVTVRITDPAGLGAEASVVVTVVDVNRAPSVQAAAAATVAEGTTVDIPLVANDDDGDPVTLAVTGPSWATLAGSAVRLSPSFDTAGIHTVIVTATDPAGASASVSILVTVGNVNRAPVLETPSPLEVAEAATAAVALVATDPDGDPVVASVSGPEFVTVDGMTLVAAPGFDDAGTHLVTVTIADPAGLTATGTFEVTVEDVNRAPTLDGLDPVTVAEGEIVSLQLVAADPDGDPLTVSIAGAGFVTSDGTALRIAPGFSSAGDHTALVSIADGRGGAASATLELHVVDVNRPPTLSVATAFSIRAGSTADTPVVATDPDGDPVTVTVTGAPFVSATAGLLWLSPTAADLGIHEIVVSADDGRGGVRLAIVTVHVLPADEAPVAVITADVPRNSVPVLVRFSGLRSYDPEGGRLRFAWDLDGDGVFDDSHSLRATRVFSIGGTYLVALRVTDIAGNSATTTFRLELDHAASPRAVLLGLVTPPATPVPPAAGLDGSGRQSAGVTLWRGSGDVHAGPGRVYLL